MFIKITLMTPKGKITLLRLNFQHKVNYFRAVFSKQGPIVRYSFLAWLILPFLLISINSRVIFSKRANEANILIDKSEIIPLKINEPIYKLALSGRVSLKNELAYFRAILVDNQQKEYLIFETSPLITEEEPFLFKDYCEETCLLEGAVPAFIRTEGKYFEGEITKIFSDNDPEKIKNLDLALEKEKFFKKNLDEKINKINKSIKTKGLRWIAGETSVSLLSYSEKKKLFRDPDGSFVDELPNLQGFEYYKDGVFDLKSEENNSIPVELSTDGSSVGPDNWDWRNVNGENWITPVKNQGSCGSCWAFGTLAAMEGVTNVFYNQHLNLDLSEQECVCTQPGSCETGGYVAQLLELLKTSGITDEQCYPYRGTESYCSLNKCSGYLNRIWKITNYQLNPADDLSLQKAIFKTGPIIFGITSWTHVMSAVGYTKNSSGQTIWIIKNSWGTSWGYSGYGKMTVPVTDRRRLYSLVHPYAAQNNPLANLSINCTDKDNDGFCYWGVSETKPSTCPSTCKPTKDCNDNNSTAFYFDANYNCSNQLPLPTTPPTKTPTTTRTPAPTKSPRPTRSPRPTKLPR